MPFDSFKHHRRSIRLKGYDYSQAGAYFVTICVQHHQNLFGNVADAEMQLNDLGIIAKDCWCTIPQHFPNVELGEYMVMPNHIHGIVVIADDCRGVQLNAPTETRDLSNPFSAISPKRKTLSVIIRTYKAAVTTRCREIDRADFVWLGNYYEHIIRNEREWNAIAKYIYDNPANWLGDLDNPTNFVKRLSPNTSDEHWQDAGL